MKLNYCSQAQVLGKLLKEQCRAIQGPVPFLGSLILILILEEPLADYHLCDIRCQALHCLGPLSPKTS